MKKLSQILPVVIIMMFVNGCGEANFSDGSGSANNPTPPRPTNKPGSEEAGSQNATQKTNPEVVSPVDSSVDANQIEFGTDVVYHLGDNDFSNSSCLNQMTEFPVTGTKFFFEFEVTEDNTKMELVVSNICGVDYAGSNFLSVGDLSGTAIGGARTLTTADFAFQMPVLTLAKGQYAIIAESKKNISMGDFDDFTIGKIKVKSDKKVIPGKIRTEN